MQGTKCARLSVQSSELGPLAPSTESEGCSSHLGPREETHSLEGEGVGVGGSNFDEGTDTLVDYVVCISL